MRGYNNETGEPLKPPKVTERKKKDPADKRYTKSFSLSYRAIKFLEKLEGEYGKSNVSRFVDALILAQIPTEETPKKVNPTPIPDVPEANQLLYDLYSSGYDIEDIAKSNGISIKEAKRRIATVPEPTYIKK